MDYHKTTAHYKAWADFKAAGGVINQTAFKYDALDFQVPVDVNSTFRSEPVKWSLPIRPLHWVIKVSDLKATIDLLCGKLGCRVLRHEEFESGCEASCNGPYSGYWSKTMVGFENEH